MKLAYQAFDQRGQSVLATIDAAGAIEATEALRLRGLFVSEIHPAEESATLRARLWARTSRRATLKGLAAFTRQLYVLISTGTPMVQALAAFERQTESERWREVVAQVRAKVEQGTPLHVAMADQPESFDAVYRSLIAAGESSGQMAPMLDRLGTLTRKQVQLRQSVAGAMLYPCVLSAIGVVVLVGMLVFVLPRFKALFDALSVPMPFTTRVMMGLSDGITHYWWAILLVAASGALSMRLWLRSESGRRKVQELVIRLPKVGRLLRSLLTARITRMLGVLLDSQVPLLEALRLTRDGAGHVLYVELLTSAEQAVADGKPLSSSLAPGGLICPNVCEAIRNGEQSGNIGPLLIHMADLLDEENEVAVRALTSLMEPLILVLLGVVVGVIALSMFLPLFDVAALAQGGGG